MKKRIKVRNEFFLRIRLRSFFRSFISGAGLGGNGLMAEKLVDFFCQGRFRESGVDGAHNLWIVKPTNQSRGRGIQVVNTLDEIIRMGLGSRGSSSLFFNNHQRGASWMNPGMSL